jgi:hypothetical protein
VAALENFEMIVAKARRVVGNPARSFAGKSARRTAARRPKAVTRSRSRRVAARQRPANRNPHVLTLGTLAINPQRRTRPVAKARRNKARAVAHASRTVRTHSNVRRSRKNPMRFMVRTPRHRKAARNPQFFGRQMKIGEIAKVVAGGMVGVGAVKMVVPMLPATLTTNNLAKFGSALVVALGLGWVANKVSSDFGSAVTFGGLMEAASIGLNPFIPVSQYTGLSGGRGLRAYMPAQFNEPQNPFPQNAISGGGAVTRVYTSPYSLRKVA